LPLPYPPPEHCFTTHNRKEEVWKKTGKSREEAWIKYRKSMEKEWKKREGIF